MRFLNADFIKAVVPLAWPLLSAIVLWRLFPTIRKVFESRAFTLKLAGIEISAQEATDQIKSQLQDLRDQVIELRNASGKLSKPISAQPLDRLSRTILWVDDEPNHDALQISQLEARGYKVLIALSTNDAMANLARDKVDLIVSDMGRREDGRYIFQAGLIFLQAARAAGYEQPFIVYTKPNFAKRNEAEVKSSGGYGAVTSPTKLLEWIETQLSRD